MVITMSNSIGEKIKLTIFGESHGEGIGMVLDGLPAGEAVDMEEVQKFMARRMGGKRYTTSRAEPDIPKVISGYFDGVTTGSPLCAIIENTNKRSQDYKNLLDIPRPSHADYPAFVKYAGHNDTRGGGHFSGRLTAPLCTAGAMCIQMLRRRGIYIGAHIASIAGVEDDRIDLANITEDEIRKATEREFPVLNEAKGEQMIEKIMEASADLDSVGGVVECVILGVPTGYGEPWFDGIENRIASAVFGIGAVRGIEFGCGFEAANMRGSEHNDAYTVDNGRIRTKTNNHGGILGGITSGMPIVFRVAFKPTPSIARAQESVSLSEMKDVPLEIRGRHDPCIVPRAVPCVEAAAAVVMMDIICGGK